MLYKRLILSHHKDLNRGDFLVDDRPHKNGADGSSAPRSSSARPSSPTGPTVVDYLTDKAPLPSHGMPASRSPSHKRSRPPPTIAQTDKAGAPYITHPARVAARFDPATRPLEHCAAWLHDVIEDTGRTADDLRVTGVHPDVLEIVDLLTRRDGIRRMSTITASPQHPRALAVKAADIDDNPDPARTALLEDETRSASRRNMRAHVTASGSPPMEVATDAPVRRAVSIGRGASSPRRPVTRSVRSTSSARPWRGRTCG